MTTPISGAPGTTPATTSTAPSASKNNMDKDLFLKLLVAQLKYQDPSKPADPTQFMAQTAQFTMVEKLEEVAKSQQQLVAAQATLQAASLIGRTVSYVNAEGREVSGVVTSARISGSNPTVRVGNTDVALSSVREVRNSTSAS